MRAIKVVTGVTPTCWRPPYGDVDVRVMFPREYWDTDIYPPGVGPHPLNRACAQSANHHLEV